MQQYATGSGSYPFDTGYGTEFGRTYVGRLAAINPTHEKALKTNFGVDARLFDGLTATFDAYWQRRSNIWVSAEGKYTSVVGMTAPYANGGIVDSYGFELGLNYNVQLGDVLLDYGGNFNLNRSKIVDMLEEPRLFENLVQTGNRVGHSYMMQDSPEVVMGVRAAKTANGNDYIWYNLRNNPRLSYCPTQEYVEMFPWADGTPFDWDKTEAAAKTPFTVKVNGQDVEIDGLDNMFIKGDKVEGSQMLQNRRYTRDPRLYENVAVNGQLQTIDWGSGRRSGANYENWVGGTTALQHPATPRVSAAAATGMRRPR